jgi:hypothetical protein
VTLNRRRALLRFSYWVGILVDAGVAVLMAGTLISKGLSAGLDGMLVRDLGVGIVLMLGWTTLLIWADRKPLERKGVLLITLIPVVLLILANNIFVVAAGYLSFRQNGFNIVGGIFLAVLFSLAYYLNRD